MHYSDNPGHVRIDFFTTFEDDRPGLRKWYMTETLDMGAFYNYPMIHDALRAALGKHFKEGWRGTDMEVVCLEPFHEHAHPISLRLTEVEKSHCDVLLAEHEETIRLGS